MAVSVSKLHLNLGWNGSWESTSSKNAWSWMLITWASCLCTCYWKKGERYCCCSYKNIKWKIPKSLRNSLPKEGCFPLPIPSLQLGRKSQIFMILCVVKRKEQDPITCQNPHMVIYSYFYVRICLWFFFLEININNEMELDSNITHYSLFTMI